jgi:hypothetical protein
MPGLRHHDSDLELDGEGPVPVQPAALDPAPGRYAVVRDRGQAVVVGLGRRVQGRGGERYRVNSYVPDPALPEGYVQYTGLQERLSFHRNDFVSVHADLHQAWEAAGHGALPGAPAAVEEEQEPEAAAPEGVADEEAADEAAEESDSEDDSENASESDESQDDSADSEFAGAARQPARMQPVPREGPRRAVRGAGGAAPAGLPGASKLPSSKGRTQVPVSASSEEVRNGSHDEAMRKELSSFIDNKVFKPAPRAGPRPCSGSARRRRDTRALGPSSPGS